MLRTSEVEVRGKLVEVKEKGKVVGRVYLYILRNSIHPKPFMFIEDLWIAESKRKQGLGSILMAHAVRIAKEEGCYKIVANSRSARGKLHDWYKTLGFKKHGFEFRRDI
jgi:GNAT superfamily N-acetyltransferase